MESINDKNPKDLFYIDVDKIVRSQQSRMVRNLPQFIINAIKKIVRQDEINRQLDLMRDRNDIDFIKAHVEYLNVTVKGWNIENLPESGRFIFVCNHPLGAVDFYAALMITREKFPVVKALANDILLNFENLKTLFLPVNAFGRSSVSYHKMMQEAYASSIQIMTFPAGEVSRKRHGEIKDGPWRGYIQVSHFVEIRYLYISTPEIPDGFIESAGLDNYWE